MGKKYNSKNYVILLKGFDLKDEQYNNAIFRELQSSSVSIVGSNGGSDSWNFIINFKQPDNLDRSKEIEEIMAPALHKYNLEIRKVWP